jgi:hypothetical protein
MCYLTGNSILARRESTAKENMLPTARHVIHSEHVMYSIQYSHSLRRGLWYIGSFPPIVTLVRFTQVMGPAAFSLFMTP